MLWALFADVHANLEALEACLEDARGRGAQRFALLGDLVGYGADPGAVTEIAMGLTASGAVSVKGNHDQAIEGTASYLNDTARAAIEWTRGQLEPRHRDYLAQLPMVAREEKIGRAHV